MSNLSGKENVFQSSEISRTSNKTDSDKRDNLLKAAQFALRHMQLVQDNVPVSNSFTRATEDLEFAIDALIG